MRRSLYRLNSTVLSCRPNVPNCISGRRSAGKLFHTWCPATEKLLSPKVLWVNGSKHVMSLAERRFWRPRIDSQLDVRRQIRRCPTRQQLIHKTGKTRSVVGGAANAAAVVQVWCCRGFWHQWPVALGSQDNTWGHRSCEVAPFSQKSRRPF